MPNTKTPAKVQKDLKLNQLPSKRFMALLEQVGTDSLRDDPPSPSPLAQPTNPQQIRQELVQAIVVRRVGELLEQARKQSGLSVTEVGEVLGVTKGRVSQMESAENLEMGSVLRLAKALDMEVEVVLRPKRGKPIVARLG